MIRGGTELEHQDGQMELEETEEAKVEAEKKLIQKTRKKRCKN